MFFLLQVKTKEVTIPKRAIEYTGRSQLRRINAINKTDNYKTFIIELITTTLFILGITIILDVKYKGITDQIELYVLNNPISKNITSYEFGLYIKNCFINLIKNDRRRSGLVNLIIESITKRDLIPKLLEKLN